MVGSITLALVFQTVVRQSRRFIGSAAGRTSSNPLGDANVPTNADGSFYVGGHTEKIGNSSNRLYNHRNTDLYVGKVNSSGALWSKPFGTQDEEYGRGTCNDLNSNVYMTGFTRGPLAGGNAGDYDIFIVKFDTEGNRLWTQQIGSPYHDEGRHIYHNEGHIYVLGHTWGALDDRAHVANGHRRAGERDVVILKLSLAGERLWTRQFGTSLDDYAFGLAFEPKTQYIYLSGRVSAGARVDGPYYQGGENTSVEVEIGVFSTGERQPKTKFSVRDQSYNFLAKYDTNGAVLGEALEGGLSFSNTELMVSEDGKTDSYSIVLRRQPMADVTIQAAVVALAHKKGAWNSEQEEVIGQVSISPSAITFTTENWQTAQKISVSCMDDDVDEALHYATITHNATSADINFNSYGPGGSHSPTHGNYMPYLGGNNVTVTISDNDFSRIEISKENAYVTEGGATDKYTVVLTSQPISTVTVHNMKTSQVVVTPTELTFTSANWKQAQLVTISAIDDSLSENVHGGTHSGGTVHHYATSTDFHYNTRRPLCYYITKCRCSSGVGTIISESLGACDAGAAAGCKSVTVLKCDTDPTLPWGHHPTACRNHVFGNGACENVVQSTSVVQTIPARYGSPNPNPKPENFTIPTVGDGQVQVEVKQVNSYFPPDPFFGGFGVNHQPHTYPHVLNLSFNPNLHPRNGTLNDLDLSFVPADVLAHLLGFFGVGSLEEMQALAQSATSSSSSSSTDGIGFATRVNEIPSLKLANAACRGVQRLTLQQWAYSEWPVGMADKVLHAAVLAIPSLRMVDMIQCGLATFHSCSSIQVTVSDNDPGITLSKLWLTTTEGAAADNYTLVLNAPPSENVGTRKSWVSTTPICSAPEKTVPAECTFLDAATTAPQIQCYTGDAEQPCDSGVVFPRRLTNRLDAIDLTGSVTVAVVGDAHVSVSPAFLTFTASNWYLPQTVKVTAVDDYIDERTENHTIGHFFASTDKAYDGTKVPVWAGPYPNPNPAPFWGGAIDSSFNPFPDHDHTPYHSRMLVTVHDDDTFGVFVRQSEVLVAEIDQEPTHSGDVMVLGAIEDATIDSRYQNHTIGGTDTLHVCYGMQRTLFKFDLPYFAPPRGSATGPGVSTQTGASRATSMEKVMLRLYKEWDGLTAHQGGVSEEVGGKNIRGQSAVFNPITRVVQDESSSSSSGGGTRYRVRTVQDAWSQGTVTWETRPKMLMSRPAGPDTPLAYVPTFDVEVGTQINQYHDIDVTEMVNMALSYGLPQISFEVEGLAHARNQTVLSERLESTMPVFGAPNSVDEGDGQKALSRFTSSEGGLANNHGPQLVVVSSVRNLGVGCPACVATMSSSAEAGVATAAMATRAIDGDTNGDGNAGSVAITATESQPWWELDLGKVESVGSVALWRRQSPKIVAKTNDTFPWRQSSSIWSINRDSRPIDYGGSNGAVWAILSNTPFTSPKLSEAITKGCPDECANSQRFDSKNRAIFWATQASGRYLRVQLESDQSSLSLAEVQVFGPSAMVTEGYDSGSVTSSPIATSRRPHERMGRVNKPTRQMHPVGARVSKMQGAINVALGKVTRQSSTAARTHNAGAAVAQLAVDGNYNGKWDSSLPYRQHLNWSNVEGRVRSELDFHSLDTYVHMAASTRTLYEKEPWWEVDLGDQLPIGSVVIWNRQDGDTLGSADARIRRDINTPAGRWGAHSGHASRWNPFDCCEDTLSAFWIMVADAQFSTADGSLAAAKTLSTQKKQFAKHSDKTAWEVHAPGRHIRVQLEGEGALMLKEVEVYLWGLAARYVMLELRSDANTEPFKKVALPEVQIFGTDHHTPLTVASIHSQSSGADTASSLVDGDVKTCYVGANGTRREWVVLDMGKVMPVTGVSVDSRHEQCSTEVTTRAVSRVAVSLYVNDDEFQAPDILPETYTNVYKDAETSCNCTKKAILFIDIGPGIGHLYVNNTIQCPCFGDLFCFSEQCLFHNGTSRNGGGDYLAFTGFEPALMLSDLGKNTDTFFSLIQWDYAFVVLRDDPIGYWRLDDNLANGNVANNLGLQGAFSNGAYAANVEKSQMHMFDGDEYRSKGVALTVAAKGDLQAGISVSTVGHQTPSVSLETWVKPDVTAMGTDMCVMGSYAEEGNATSFAVTISSSGMWNFEVSQPGSPPSALEGTSAVYGQWTHVVATFDGLTGKQTLYTNGVELITKTKQNGEAWSYTQPHRYQSSVVVKNVSTDLFELGEDTSLSIGGGCKSLAGFIGSVAEVAVYDTCLSQAQVLDHYMFSEARGNAGSYQIELQSQPLSDVTVAVHADSQCYRTGKCNATVFPSSLTFTSGNWNQSQTVIVTASNDDIVEAKIHLASISHTVNSSITMKLVTGLVLEGQLAQDLETSLNMSKTVERIAALKLRNDLTLQTEITGLLNKVNDQSALWQRQQVSEIFFPYDRYTGAEVAPVSALVTDNDAPAIVLSTPVVFVKESWYADGYTMALATEPSADVTVDIYTDRACFRQCGYNTDKGKCSTTNVLAHKDAKYDHDGNFGNSFWYSGESSYLLCNSTVSVNQLIFTAHNWILPQPVVVTPVDDDLDEASPHLSNIVYNVTSADVAYHNIHVPSTIVNVTDNDFSAVNISKRNWARDRKPTLYLNEGGGGFDGIQINYKVGPGSKDFFPKKQLMKADAYQINLNTEPFSAVTISVHTDLYGECYRDCGYPTDQFKFFPDDELTCGDRRVHEVQTIRTHAPPAKEVQIVEVRAAVREEVHEITQLAERAAEIAAEVIRVELTGDRTHEVQKVYTQANPFEDLDGTFTLSFRGNTTQQIPFDAPESVMIKSLEELPTVATVDVIREEHPLVSGIGKLEGYIWAITFTGKQPSKSGSYNDGDLPLFEYDNKGIVGGQCTGACDGYIKVEQVQQGKSIFGTFDLLFNNLRTVPITSIATATEVSNSLQNLPDVSALIVTRSPFSNRAGSYVWSISFTRLTDQAIISHDLGPPKWNLTVDTRNMYSPEDTLVNASNEIVQNWNIIRGSFVITLPVTTNGTVVNYATRPLPWNCSESAMEDALEELSLVGEIRVSRLTLSWTPYLGDFQWTIMFRENMGNLPNSVLNSTLLTGIEVVSTIRTAQDGNTVGGEFTISMEGDFMRTFRREWYNSSQNVLDQFGNMPYTSRGEDGETYNVYQEKVTTVPLPYNATARMVQEALFDLNFTDLLDVVRTPWKHGIGDQLECGRDGLIALSVEELEWKRCRGYTFEITFARSPGNVPQFTSDSTKLTGLSHLADVTTIMDGNYISGNFTVTITGTGEAQATWPLPHNISAAGMDEALEAVEKVSQRREDAHNRPKYGVEVSRTGPDMEGGYEWRIVWSSADTNMLESRMVDLNSSLLEVETSAVTFPVPIDQDGSANMTKACKHYPGTTQELIPQKFGAGIIRCHFTPNATVTADRRMCNLTVAPDTLTFTPQNWNMPQIVTVTPLDDEVDEGFRYKTTDQFEQMHTAVIAHTASSDDYKYDQILIDNITAQIQDDDTAYVYVSKENVTVEEGGATDSYTMQLETEPRFAVKIRIYPWLNWNNKPCYRWNLCNTSISPEAMTFTPENWFLPQTVTVTAVDDFLDEYDVHRSLLVHSVHSDDLRYHRIPVDQVTAYIKDNDLSAVNISKPSVVVHEGSFGDNYTINLNSEPWAKVTIDINGGEERGNKVVAEPSRLTFTYRNWMMPQTVQVDAFDDMLDDDEPHYGRVHHKIRAKDYIYNDMAITQHGTNISRQNVSAEIYDNDVSGVTIVTSYEADEVGNSTDTVFVQEGGTRDYNNYTLVLDTEPWNNVTVNVVTTGRGANCYREDLCNVTTLPYSLTFTWDNWYMPQTVTVFAVDDHLDEYNPHKAPMRHVLVSDDKKYEQGVAVRSLTADILDNDLSGVTVFASSIPPHGVVCAEGSFKDRYTIVLDTEPYADVRVTIETPLVQLVEKADDGKNLSSTVRQVFFDGPTMYYTKWLKPPVAGDIFEVTGVPMPVNAMRNYTIFTPENWNIPQTVIVGATDDDINEGGTHYVPIHHLTTSVDPYYNRSAQIVDPEGEGENHTTGLMEISDIVVTISESDKEPPPIMESAVFSHSAAQIYVDFNAMVFHEARAEKIFDGARGFEVNKVKQGDFDCKLIFQHAEEHLLGDDYPSTACQWIGVKLLSTDERRKTEWYGAQRVVITLGKNAKVKPGDLLTLNACTEEENGACKSKDVVKARGWSQLTSKGSIPVSVLADQPPAAALLAGPQAVGSCSGLALDGSASNWYGGGRPVTYTWYVLEGSHFATKGVNDTHEDFAELVTEELENVESQLAVDCASGWYKIPRCSAGLTIDCLPQEEEPAPSRQVRFSLRALCQLWDMTNQTNARNLQTGATDLVKNPKDLTSAQFQVRKGIMEPGSLYTFLMRVDTFLLQTAMTSQLVSVNKDPLPTVLIQGDKERFIKRPQDLWLIGTAEVSCPEQTGTALTWLWEQVEGDFNMSDPVFTQQITRPKLNIPPGTLTAGGSYLMRVWAIFTNLPDVRSSATVRISVGTSELEANLGAAKISVGVDRTVIFNASGSVDPDDIDLPLTFDFTCRGAETGNPCKNSATGELLMVDNLETSTTKGGLVIRNTANYGVVQNNSLTPNTDYIFTLTVRKQCSACQYADISGSYQRDREGRCPPKPEPPGIPTIPIDETCLHPPRNHSVDVLVTAMAGLPPIVLVTPMEQAKMPASEQIPLRGSVSSSRGPLTLVWTQLAGDLDMSSLSEEDNTHPAFLVPLNMPEISIRPNFLTAGSVYTFMLTATDRDNLYGFAEISFTVNGPPTSGIMIAEPKTGFVLETEFEFGLTSWVDDASDLPLTYAYSFIIGGDETHVENSLASNLQSDVFTTGLQGSPTDAITAVGYVYDQFGSSARVTSELTVEPKKHENAAQQMEYLQNQTNALLDAALESGDLSAIANLVGALSFLLNDAAAIIPGEITPSSTTCPGSRGEPNPRVCSGHGDCLSEIVDTQPVAVCTCHAGWNLNKRGDCALSDEELARRMAMREMFIDAVKNSVGAQASQAELGQAAGTLVGVVASPTELSSKAQDNAGNLLNSVVSFSAGGGGKGFDSTAGFVAQGASSLLTASSTGQAARRRKRRRRRKLAAVDLNCGTTWEDSLLEARRLNSIYDTLRMTSAISTASMLVGQVPQDIVTGLVQMRSERLQLIDGALDNKVLIKLPSSQTFVSLAENLFDGVKVQEPVFSTMLEWKKDPHLWANSSCDSEQLSKVLSVSLQDGEALSKAAASQMPLESIEVELDTPAVAAVVASEALISVYLANKWENFNENKSVECRTWDEGSLRWTTDLCSFHESSSTVNLTVCHCRKVQRLDVVAVLVTKFIAPSFVGGVALSDKDDELNDSATTIPTATICLVYFFYFLTVVIGLKVDASAQERREKNHMAKMLTAQRTVWKVKETEAAVVAAFWAAIGGRKMNMVEASTCIQGWWRKHMADWQDKLHKERESKFRSKLGGALGRKGSVVKDNVGSGVKKMMRSATIKAKQFKQLGIKGSVRNFWKVVNEPVNNALAIKDGVRSKMDAAQNEVSRQVNGKLVQVQGTSMARKGGAIVKSLLQVEEVSVEAHKEGHIWVGERKARRLEKPAFGYEGVAPLRMRKFPEKEYDVRVYPRRQSVMNFKKAHDKPKLVGKMYMMLVNVVFELVGLFVMCVGTDLFFGLGNVTASVLARIYGKELGMCMFSVGIVMQLLTICGYLGAKRESRKLLSFYVMFSFVCWCLQIAIVLIAYKSATDYGNYPMADTAIKNQWIGMTVGERTDTQSAYGCCGWSTIHDAAEQPCPEESIVDAFNPRSCQPILMDLAAEVMSPIWSLGSTIVGLEAITILVAHWMVHKKKIEEQELLYRKKIPAGTILARWVLGESNRFLLIGGTFLFLIGVDLVKNLGYVVTGVISNLFGYELGVAMMMGSGILLCSAVIGRVGAVRHDKKKLVYYFIMTIGIVMAELLLAAVCEKTSDDLTTFSTVDDHLRSAYSDLSPFAKNKLHTTLECCGYAEVPPLAVQDPPCPFKVDTPCKGLLEKYGYRFASNTGKLAMSLTFFQAFNLLLTGILLFRTNQHADADENEEEKEQRRVALQKNDPYMYARSGEITRALQGALVVLKAIFLIMGVVTVLGGVDLVYSLGYMVRGEVAHLMGPFMGSWLLSMGLFTCCISVIGIYGVLMRKKGYLFTYTLFMFFMLIMYLMAGAVAYRAANNEDVFKQVDSYGLAAWMKLPEEMKDTAQRALSCCGYTSKFVPPNNTKMFRFPYQRAVFKRVTVNRYMNRTVVEAIETASGSVRYKSHLEQVLVTANETFLTHVDACPTTATDGCREVITESIKGLSTPLSKVAIGFATIICVCIALAVAVYFRQGNKWKTTFRLRVLIGTVLCVESYYVLVGLVVFFVGCDLMGGYGFFITGVVAELFGNSLGGGLIVLGLSATVNSFVGLYGTMWREVSNLMAFIVINLVLAMGTMGMGTVAYRYHSGSYSSESLGDNIRLGWLMVLSKMDRSSAQELYQCCGFDDPITNLTTTPPTITFDLAALPCPRNVTKTLFSVPNATLGCRHVLVNDVLLLTGPLGKGGIATGLAHLLALGLALLLLQEMCKLMPWLWGRYKLHLKKSFKHYVAKLKLDHTLASIGFHDDAKYTRPQRLTTTLTLMLGMMALLAILYGHVICNVSEDALLLDETMVAETDCIYPSPIVKLFAGIMASLVVWPAMHLFKLGFRKAFYSRPYETLSEIKERHRLERVLRQSHAGLGRGHTAEQYVHAVQLAIARWIFVIYNLLRFVGGAIGALVGVLVAQDKLPELDLYGMEKQVGLYPMVGLGGVCIFTTFLGLLGTLKIQNARLVKAILAVYILFAALLCLAAAAGGLMGTVLIVNPHSSPNEIQQMSGLYMEKVADHYWESMNDQYKNETQFEDPQCCGFGNYIDRSVEPCPVANSTITTSSGETLTTKTLPGCKTKMIDKMAEFLSPFAICLLSLALTELLCIGTAYFILTEWYSPQPEEDANPQIKNQNKNADVAARAVAKDLKSDKPVRRGRRRSSIARMADAMTDFASGPQKSQANKPASKLNQSYMKNAATRQTRRMSVGEHEHKGASSAGNVMDLAHKIGEMMRSQKDQGTAPKVAKRTTDQPQFYVDPAIKLRQSKKTALLPYWILHVVYGFAVSWCIMCTIITMVQVRQLSADMAEAWLVSFVIAMVQHQFVSEPLGVLVQYIMMPAFMHMAKGSWLAQMAGFASGALAGKDVTWTPFQTESPLLQVRHSAARIIQQRWIAIQTKKNFRILLEKARDQRREGEEMERREKMYAARESFTEEELDAFQMLFNDFDLDSNGTIDLDELNHALARMGRSVPRTTVRQLLRDVDLDGSGTVNFDEFLFVVAKIRSQSVSSRDNALADKDTLTLKELIESKLPADNVHQVEAPKTPRSIKERKEEAVSKVKSAKQSKKNKLNQIMPAEGTNLHQVKLPPLSTASPSNALTVATEGTLATPTPRADPSLETPRSKAKLKSASQKLRGAELLVRTPKMPAGLPVKGTGKPKVLTTTQKDLHKAIQKSQKGPKKVKKGRGVQDTQDHDLGAGGVRKLRPAKGGGERN